MKLLGLFAVLLLSFMLACSKANRPETPKPSAANQSASSAPVAMKVDLKVDPAEPNPSKPAKFTVRLTDPDGKPVTGADVDISLVMKTMDMGKNEFKLADKGNGGYEGEGKFGMAGDWNAVVTAKEPGKSATQSFPVKSVMPKP
jgi:YtkA-like